MGNSYNSPPGMSRLKGDVGMECPISLFGLVSVEQSDKLE